MGRPLLIWNGLPEREGRGRHPRAGPGFPPSPRWRGSPVPWGDKTGQALAGTATITLSPSLL